MSVKLKDALFEISNNNIHKIFENKKERPIEGNIQSLSRATLETISKAIAAKINSSIPSIEKIEEDVLSKPLGIVTFQMLKKLGLVSIKGLKLDPVQVKGEQQQGLSPMDFSKYEKNQIVPLFLTNKEMENLGGTKGDEEFAAIFYIPSIYAPIKKENLSLHKQLFGIEDPPKGKAAMHVAINKLHYEMIDPKEIELVQKSFMTGNSTPLQRIEKMQGRRRPTGGNEKMGGSDDEQSDESLDQTSDEQKESKKESLNIENLKKLHENSLTSLLFEKKIDEGPKEWFHKVFGGKKPELEKGSSTSYVNVDIDEFDLEKEKEKQQKKDDDSNLYGLLNEIYSNNGIIYSQSTVDNFVDNKSSLKIIALRTLDGTDTMQDKNGVYALDVYALDATYINLDFTNNVYYALQSIEGSSKDYQWDKINKRFDIHTEFEANSSNAKLICDRICKTNGEIDAASLFKALPKMATSTDFNDSNPIVTHDCSQNLGNFKYDLFVDKKVKNIIDISKGKYYVRSDNFEKTFNFGDDEHSVTDKVSGFTISYNFLNKKFSSQKHKIKIAEFVRDFNEITSEDSEELRKAKAVNVFVVICSKLFDIMIDNPNVESVLKTEYEDITKSKLSEKPKAYFTEKMVSGVVSDDEEGESLKSALVYLKKRLAANRSDWKGFKHDASDQSASDASLDAVINNIDFNDENKLLKSTDLSIAANGSQDDVVRIVKDVKFDFESAKGSVEKAKEVFDYYGEGAELLKKIYQIVASAVKGDADHVPMSGDQTERVSKKEKTGDFLKEFDKVFKDEFKRLSPILKKEYNIKSKDFVGNKYIMKIAEAIKEGKSIKVDLDELVKSQIEMSNLESFINANAVLRKLKEDKADLTTQLEKLDEASFEEDLTKVMTKMIANSIQGILGSNSSMLDHKRYSNNLMLEVSASEKSYAQTSFWTTTALTAVFTIANAITGGAFAATVIASSGLFMISGLWKGTITWREHSEILAGRGKYESMDMYAEEIIKTSLPIVLKCCASAVGNMYASGLIGIEDELKENGVTLTYTSEALESLSDDVKSNQAKSAKKENLNELGKKIYSEIIDAAYEFKKTSPIGKYINQSSIENMLQKTMFSGEIRNKFAKLIDLLQEDEKELQTSGFVYKLGLRDLLKEANEDQDSGESKKSKTRETIEINKLRVQLATIITKEFGTANFRNDINQAFIKELKKHEKDLPGRFDMGSSTKKKKIKAVLVKVLNKVLGMSEKDAKEFFEDNAELFETFNRDDIDLILESQDLKMIINEVDLVKYVFHNPNTGKSLIYYATDAKNVSNPLRVLGNKVTGTGSYGGWGITGDWSGTPTPPKGFIDITNTQDGIGTVKDATQVYTGFNGKISPDMPAATTTPNTPSGYDPSSATGTEILAGITSLLALANLSLMIANWIRPILHRNIKTGAELQKVLSDCQWDTLPGVAFAEIICQILVANQTALSEQGIKITGKLSNASKPSQAGSVGSSVLVNKIKGAMSPKAAKKLKAENITDEQIIDAIRGDLSKICMGIVKKYDKEKYKDTIETADRETYKSEKDKMRMFGWFRSKRSHENILQSVSGDKITSKREESLKAATKSDVDAISKAIVAMVRNIKDINLESALHLNKLKDLLFETSGSIPDGTNMPGSKKHSITAEELQSALSSTGCLVYGSDLDPDSPEFRKAENYLVGTIGNFLSQNFGVSVKGIDQFKKLNMVEETVAQTVDKESPAGQPASQEIQNMTSGSGIPMNTQAPFDMSQMMYLMNMCGGNPMFMMMMIMMQHPHILQNLQKMQTQGNATLQDAIDVVKKEEPEELSDIDQAIAQAIKNARDSFPAIAKQDVQKLWHTLKKDPFKGNEIFEYELVNDATDPQTFVVILKQYFRIVEGTVNYTYDNTSVLTDFILNKTIKNKKLKDNLLQYSDSVYIDSVMSKITNAEKSLSTYCDSIYNELYASSYFRHTYTDEKAACNAIIKGKNTFADLLSEKEIDVKEGITRLFKDVADKGQAVELSTESRLRRVKPLSRRVSSLQVIKEAKFLEQEFKRLWNLR